MRVSAKRFFTSQEGGTNGRLRWQKLLKRLRPLRAYAVAVEGNDILVGPEKAAPEEA
jgi:hypothetical protein